MSSKKRKELTQKEIEVLFYGIYDPEKPVEENFYRFARAVEFETRECCAYICLDVYKRSFAEWKDDNNRYNLGYAHGADECLYAFTGRTIVD
jgi:hypothetical protein